MTSLGALYSQKKLERIITLCFGTEPLMQSRYMLDYANKVTDFPQNLQHDIDDARSRTKSSPSKTFHLHRRKASTSMMMCGFSFFILAQHRQAPVYAVLISQPHNTAQEQIPLASFWASLKGHSNFWTVGLTWRNYSLGFLPESRSSTCSLTRLCFCCT